MKTSPFWELTFFCLRKLNFWIWEGDFLRRASQRVLMCSLFLSPSIKKIEVFSEGKARRKILCFRVCFRKINILDESWKSVCVKTSQEKTSWVSRNVWIMAIYGFCLSLFTGFVATSFEPMILIWSYSNVFGVCWQGS